MRTIKGNLLDVTDGIIVQQVNCQNAMGAGLARQLMTKWPVIAERYHEFCSKHVPRELLGTCLPVSVTPTVTVVNIFGQLHYGNAARTNRCYTNYAALIDGIRRTCAKFPGRNIYLPYHIGCGLAGGNWDYVQRQLQELPVIVVCP